MENNNFAPVRLVSASRYGPEAVAAAARVSTTQGSAETLFRQATAKPAAENEDLIRKVIGSGHTSILEHMAMTFAFSGVSAFAEQFLIEFRLASPTVKSRRYVDFSGQGYYTPPDLEGRPGALAAYRNYMDTLFDAYARLLDLGVPKEDARFLLPYAYKSNFYVTANAREWIHIINTAYGRGIPELAAIADRISADLGKLLPPAAGLVRKPDPCGKNKDYAGAEAEPFRYTPAKDAGRVTALDAPSAPMVWLRRAWYDRRPGSRAWDLPDDDKIVTSDPRALELVSILFRIRDISLPALTHLTRHRMQSIVIPHLEGIRDGNHILPESVESGDAAMDLYACALENAFRTRRSAEKDPDLALYMHYMLPSAILIDVMTRMDAREIAWFVEKRACRRAQWEIRNIAENLARESRRVAPDVFPRLGPPCERAGSCPEGALGCGRCPPVKADRK